MCPNPDTDRRAVCGDGPERPQYPQGAGARPLTSWGGYSYGAVVAVQAAPGTAGARRTGAGCPWTTCGPWRPQTRAWRPTRGCGSFEDVPAEPGPTNRPGAEAIPATYITIHETGNFAEGADAAAHAAYLRGGSAQAAPVQLALHAWTTTASASTCRTSERAYHAGDGGSGPGNATTIGIEICVDAGRGLHEQARANAAALVRLLMGRHGIPLDRRGPAQPLERQGLPKDNPDHSRRLGGVPSPLRRPGVRDVGPELGGAAVDTLAAAGIIDSPERWKALDFTANSVRLLLIKMGRYVTN